MTTREKISVSWDELNSEQVEQKVKRQEHIEAARRQYESAPVPEALLRNKKSSAWYNTLVYMSVFGLLGGLLGWGTGALLSLRPDLQSQAQELLATYQKFNEMEKAERLSADAANRARQRLAEQNAGNPYFMIAINPKLTPEQRIAEQERVRAQDQLKDFIANVLFYGACGLMIALSLAAAEPLVQRNVQGAIINGSVGATLGLLGGVAVALFIDRFQQLIIGDAGSDSTRVMVARAASWGVLGLFLSLGPGIVMRNRRRLIVGLIGGFLGGALGGVLYDPVVRLAQSPNIGRLAGICAIGLIAGLGTGLVENVAKGGWLKVTEGLIAGKQFVLYRNPTYLGSSPHCQVYLFKDAAIGKRHAAIHIVPGGFELENLPLGGATLVNGKPVTRVKLRHGDRVQIGGTQFLFQEKAKG